jgi:hypothetical protein
MKTPFVAITAAAALAYTNVGAAVIVLDNFTTNQTVQVTGAAPPTQTSSSTVTYSGLLSDIQREIIVNKTGGGDTPANTAVANVSSGILQISMGNDTDGTVTLNYTRLDLTPVDLIAFGLNAIAFELPNAPNNDLDVTFSLNNGASVANAIFPSGTGVNDFFLPFSSFSDPSAFRSYTSSTLILTGNTAWDASIGAILGTTVQVPVPGTPLLIGVGGLLLLRRKSRRAFGTHQATA